MDWNSLWVSIAPLIAFNVVLLATVLIFRPVYRRSRRMEEVEVRHASRFLNRWMREYWLWLTDPVVRLLVRLRFTPNILTITGVLFSVASGYFLWRGRFGLGGWFMILAGSFDIFDGRVARVTGSETRSGAYFDSVMDRISETAVFLGLAMHYRLSWALWIVVAGLVGSFMVSYTKAQGLANGVNYGGGSMQRPERIVYLGVGAIFAPVFGFFLSAVSPDITDYIYLAPLTLVAVMTWVTTVDRIKNIMLLIQTSETGKNR